MGFLDPKPITAGGLDAATADRINDPASQTRLALDGSFTTPSEVASAVAPKLDKTEASTTYAAKSVETTKLDKTEATATYATTASVTAQVSAEVPPEVADYIANDPSVVQSAATMAQNTAGLVPVWKASTSYTAGQRVIAPNGDVVSAKVSFTSTTTYDAANWNASTQDGRVAVLESEKITKPALANSTNLDTVDSTGIYPIVGFTAANSMTPRLPVIATSNYTHERTGPNNARQRQETTAAPYQTWERVKDAGVWRHPRRVDPPEPLSLMHLSRSAGTAYFETATNGHVRFPCRVGTTMEDVFLNIENRDDRTDTPYTGAVTITSAWAGPAEIVNGEMTGKFLGTPTQILTGPIALPTDGTKYTSALISRNTFRFDPHVSYLVTFGFTGDGSAFHRSIGGCWRGAFSSEAGSTNPSTLTQSKFAPFTAWLSVRARAPRFGMLGDSHAVGNNALFPVFQSPINLFALANGGIPVNIGHGGSQLNDWRSVAQYKYQKYQVTLAAEDTIRSYRQVAVRLDGLIIQGGQNDLYNGALALATVKDNFIVTANACRGIFGPNIWAATMMPRNGIHQTPAQDADRVAYNDWLRGLPSQIVGVVDFAAAIADPVNPSVIDARYVDPDGVHLNTAGCWKLAESIPSGFGRNVTY